MNATEFLTAELAHAERQLARVRRLSAAMAENLTAQGLDEIAVYEKLAASKAYRQLQRDEVVFQQMWLRVHRHLQRTPPTKTKPTGIPIDELMASLRPAPIAAQPQPYRKPPAPGPNHGGHPPLRQTA